MTKIRLVWGSEGVAEAEDVERLDAILDQLTREAEIDDPFVVDLVSDGHGTLSLGLGRDETVLSFVPSSLDPPYYASRGADAASDGFLEFFYNGSLSEVPRADAVPVDVGREAARRFLRHPEALPDNLEWHEV